MFMKEKTRHVLKVYSQDISLFSSDSEEYMKNLASFVDKRMRNFSRGISRISFGDLCILTALSIADDLHKGKWKAEGLKADKQRLEKDLSEAFTRIMTLEAGIREKDSRIETLEEKVRELDLSLSTKIENKEAMTKKLNVLSYELRKPLTERNVEKDLEEAYALLEEKDVQEEKDGQGEEGAQDEKDKLLEEKVEENEDLSSETSSNQMRIFDEIKE